MSLTRPRACCDSYGRQIPGESASHVLDDLPRSNVDFADRVAFDVLRIEVFPAAIEADLFGIAVPCKNARAVRNAGALEDARSGIERIARVIEVIASVEGEGRWRTGKTQLRGLSAATGKFGDVGVAVTGVGEEAPIAVPL